MFVDKDKPFRSGLRFESTDVMDDRWYNWRFKTGELSGMRTLWK